MIFIKNTQRKIKINSNEIKANVLKMLSVLNLEDFEITIWFTTDASIQKYNKQYRKIDKTTDILSFPFHDLIPGQRPPEDDEKMLGDIIISLETAQRNTLKQNQPLKNHLNMLLAHGITHLLGYNHITDQQFLTMNKIEKKLLKSIQPA